MTIKLFFSDVDSTLIHKIHDGYRIPSENKYISKESVELMKKIMKFIPVTLITGRRITGYERLEKVIPHQFAIIEHGCIILRKNKIDKRYAREFKKYIGKPWKKKKKGLLWDYEQQWINHGYIVDSKDRYGSFRIDPNTNKLNHSQIKNILNTKHPHGIKNVINGDFIDFIPPMGGKGHAINYILHKTHSRWADVAGFGDDYNDLEMLHSAGHPFTLKNAVSKIKTLVYSRKGYISPEETHKGTEDVLGRVLFEVSK